MADIRQREARFILCITKASSTKICVWRSEKPGYLEDCNFIRCPII